MTNGVRVLYTRDRQEAECCFLVETLWCCSMYIKNPTYQSMGKNGIIGRVCNIQTTFSIKEEAWAYKTSLTPPFLLKNLYQERK